MKRMFTIKTLNNIAKCGIDVFGNENYTIDNANQAPDAYLLRSFNMHDMEVDQNVKAIARAGAGVNNIPVSKYTEQGIVVFNTPGANANAVKELVLTSLMASSRNLFAGVLWTKNLDGKGEEIPKLVKLVKNNLSVKKSKEKH